MKHVGRAVFFACLTALLLLGMRQLVVAPESASAESSPAPPGIPAVMTAALPAPESVMPAPSARNAAMLAAMSSDSVVKFTDACPPANAAANRKRWTSDLDEIARMLPASGRFAT